MQQPTLRQFEVFLAVAKAGSFRAAAEAMHLSQPALSQHVAEMERELGTRLFDRLGRKVALTEAGRVLEEHAHRLFASLASAREAVADLSGLKRGSLVPGASTTPDRKSTRLNSSHQIISYAVFCLKKKKRQTRQPRT